jgi:hypothetical protein
VTRGASKQDLDKIRAVFNTVKQTRVTQEEVDDFDAKMELYEHHLKHENPKKYKVRDDDEIGFWFRRSRSWLSVFFLFLLSIFFIFFLFPS